MSKMLHIGAKMFFGIADESNNRVLHPAKVTEVSQNICACTAELEKVNGDGFVIENGQELPIYYEFKHEFTQQAAQIVDVRENEDKLIADFTTIGKPVSAERRQCYRVSTLVSELTATIAPDDVCQLVDVSVTGLSIISNRNYRIGAILDVTLSYEDQQYTGAASIQSIRELSHNKIRYGFHAVNNRNSNDNLAEGLRRICTAVQQQQLRRLAGVSA
jgi:hypothetical protein